MANRSPSPPSSHPVDLWLMDPGTATPAWLDRHLALLDPDEARRGAAFGRGDLRHDYVCTRILQRLALSRAADVAPAAWRFAPAAGGKPKIVAPERNRTIGFNVSHTKGLIALAVCREGDVGIDVEALSNARDIAAVAHRFFAPEEAEALGALDEPRRPLRFLTLWTLKEAYLKALGTGLARPLDAVRFRFEADGSFTPYPVREASDWCFETLRLPPDDGPASGPAVRALPSRPAGDGGPEERTKGNPGEPTPAHVLGLVWRRGSTPRDDEAAPQPRWFVPAEEER